ncbi:MAG: hypothetical protein AAF628_11050 [Planctomycetota bacterium]
MRTPHPTCAIAALSLLVGCADDAVEQQAIQVFEEFQSALFAGDQSRLRDLLSMASRPALAELPLDQLRDKQPLRDLRARRMDPRIIVTGRDPNENGARASYVIVKEAGELRVDLHATAAIHHTERPSANPVPKFEFRSLTEAELAQAGRRSPSPR